MHTPPLSSVSGRDSAGSSPRHRRWASALAAGVLAAAAAAACGGSSTADGAHGSGAAGDSGSEAPGGGTAASGGSTGSSGGSVESGGSSTVSTGGSTSGPTGSAGTGAFGAVAGAAGATSIGSTACNNGLDDDGDGLVDGLDPECTGPYDQDEGSFATGVPGDNQDPKWQDCFFDGNSGAGDDGCRYPTSCLYGTTAADDPACQVAEACRDYCAPLTPNGCDCFGCCTVQTPDGDSVDIFTTATCSLAALDDEKACPRCTKSTSCGNTCGECELCPGKTVDDLPATCVPDNPPTTGDDPDGGTPDDGDDPDGGTPGEPGTPPPAYTCDEGQQVCGEGLPSCPAGFYCQLGCCTVVVR